MEDFVPFELAVKLKEKGFPQDIQHCIGWYPTEYYKNACIGEYFEEELQKIEDYFADRISAIHIIESEKKGVIAPTISQVLKWLREEKKIHICIDIYDDGWFFDIASFYKADTEVYEIDLPYKSSSVTPDYDSFEQAALAGIEYVLDNLI